MPDAAKADPTLSGRDNLIAQSRAVSGFAHVVYVFLDRDGVINRKLPEGKYVTRAAELELLPGAPESIASLNQSGRKVIVVTNQRGIALGLMSESGLDEIHQTLRTTLAKYGATLDAIYYCPHDRGTCDCRKPGTGMIRNAFRDFADAKPENSILIGESASDIQCGNAAGMATVFIEGDGGNQKPGFERARVMADVVAPSLAAATHSLLI
jgi:D-glycero-D-manno-heptose 1,7-bisphosphate phosphatase